MGLFGKLFGGKASELARPRTIDVVCGRGDVLAPVSGTVEPMEAIPDPVFSCGAMGTTLGVWPSDGNVYAPIAGKVTAAMPHAFGIVGADGVEVLVHVGIDTVDMAGDGFTVYAKVGDELKAGECFLSFDREKVARAGHKDIVITIITNSDDIVEAGGTVFAVASGEVAAGDILMIAEK